MIQLTGLLGNLLGPLIKVCSNVKNVIKSLPKSVLTPLALTAAASVADAETHKKNLVQGLQH